MCRQAGEGRKGGREKRKRKGDFAPLQNSCGPRALCVPQQFYCAMLCQRRIHRGVGGVGTPQFLNRGGPGGPDFCTEAVFYSISTLIGRVRNLAG